MSELKDCPPLKYYDFKPVEHVKVCPRYTAVLGRSEDDGIGIEELDTLQLELETLLSSASRRLRALEEQRQVRSYISLHFFSFASLSSLSLTAHDHLKLIKLFPTDPYRLAGQKRRQKVHEDGERSRSDRLLPPSEAKEAKARRKGRSRAWAWSRQAQVQKPAAQSPGVWSIQWRPTGHTPQPQKWHSKQVGWDLNRVILFIYNLSTTAEILLWILCGEGVACSLKYYHYLSSLCVCLRQILGFSRALLCRHH